MWLCAVAVALAAVAVGAGVAASGELAGGVAELPRHWWSTLAVALPSAAAVAAWWLARRQRSV